MIVTLVTAADTMTTVDKAGLAIPDDVSFLSFHNGPLADMLYPRLTILDVPMDHIAACATDGLIGSLEGRRRSIEAALPAGGVVERQSLAPVDPDRR